MGCCESQSPTAARGSTTSMLSISRGQRRVSFLLCHMFVNLFELFSSNNLLIPSEEFPQWILVWFSTPLLKGMLFLPVQYNPCRVCTNSGPYNPLPVLQVGNSSNQAYLLIYFRKLYKVLLKHSLPPFADFPLPRLYHSIQCMKFMYKLWFSLHFKY